MKKKPDAGGPAFPIHPDMPSRIGCVNSKSDAGMTLRDYFASSALAGGLEQGSRDTMDGGWWHYPSLVAERAYDIADAMLEARNK